MLASTNLLLRQSYLTKCNVYHLKVTNLKWLFHRGWGLLKWVGRKHVVMIQIYSLFTFATLAAVTTFIITSVLGLVTSTICWCLLFVFSFSRFGLSNRFDTEFPSVLTGKVPSLFSLRPLPPLALQSHSLSVHFQVGRIKQWKPQWFYCSFGP